MWRVIKYSGYFSLLLVIIALGCAPKHIAINEAYASLHPVKQLEYPEPCNDNLIIIIDNACNPETNTRNSIDVYVNDVNINLNRCIIDTATSYIYNLRVKPGYYKIKAIYQVDDGKSDDVFGVIPVNNIYIIFPIESSNKKEFNIITREKLVKVTHHSRTLVSTVLERKANGDLLNKKNYFLVQNEPLNNKLLPQCLEN